eukprot:COSAG02_NODE_2109_length_9808_cov_4.669379_7_plen_54_part_00
MLFQVSEFLEPIGMFSAGYRWENVGVEKGRNPRTTEKLRLPFYKFATWWQTKT